MKIQTALTLGRVSNLPTIWTNCFVGFAIADDTPGMVPLLSACVAFSLFYTAGMFLNDLFDYQWDSLHQPERPMVKGEADSREILRYSILMLTVAAALTLSCSTHRQLPASALATLSLVACILLYNWKHKEWSFSPWLMGLCRALVYWTVALTASPFSLEIAMPGLCLMGYIAGITYLARSEHANTITAWWPIGLLAAPVVYGLYQAHLSPLLLVPTLALVVWLALSVKTLLPGQHRNIPESISRLLASICLLDALFLAGSAHFALAGTAVCAFLLTLLLQKKIKAT